MNTSVRVVTVLLIALMALTGCSTASTSGSLSNSATTERDGVQLHFSANGSEFQGSDPIRFHAEVANRGWQPVDYFTANIGDAKISLGLRPKGADTWETLYDPDFKGGLTMIDRLQLSPGYVLTRDFEWPKRIWNGDGAYEDAPAGEYVVRATFWMGEATEEGRLSIELEFTYLLAEGQ